jgi:hypothetical protein
MRLEGSFETPRKYAAPQDEVGDIFTSSQDEAMLIDICLIDIC